MAQYNAPGNSDVDWPVIRYADVLLMYAECLNETGATAMALQQVNRVRSRAGLPALAGLDQLTARTAIQKERRIELAFEGHRWHDLIRYGTAVSTMQAYKTKYNVRNMQVMTPEKQIFPIPQRERNIMPELPQNPGY